MSDDPPNASPPSPAPGPVPTWTIVQRRLHWAVALLVLGQFLLQGPMRAAIEAVAAGEAVTLGQFAVTTLHTWGGAGVGALLLWRLRLRRTHPVPVAAGRLGSRMARLVGFHHGFLYVALLAMVLSGALHYYAGVTAAARWHELGKWAVAAGVALHLIGALAHALRPGDPVLQRMLIGVGRRS